MKMKNENGRLQKQRGITLIALVVTIALNCSYLAMELMSKNVNVLKI